MQAAVKSSGQEQCLPLRSDWQSDEAMAVPQPGGRAGAADAACGCDHSAEKAQTCQEKGDCCILFLKKETGVLI